MADYTTSASMGLPIPVVGIAPGPDWATLLNNCLTIIDAHSHVPGSGVPITPSAININSDLPMGINNLTDVRSVRFEPNPAALSLPTDIGVIYEAGDDLYYNDGLGNQIRLTQAGSIVGTAGSITGLPSGTASASFTGVGATFVWQSATNIAANMDFGSAVFRNTSPNSTFGVTVSPVAGLGSNYALTLPTLPVSTRVLSLSPAGIISTGVAATIVTADVGNQQVTQEKLAPRTIAATAPAGGIAISTLSSGTFTTTSTTAVDITNLNITLTTTGRPIWLGLMSSDDGADGFSSITISSAGGTIYTRLRLVNVTSGGVSVLFSEFNELATGAMSTIVTLAAGTYNFKAQLEVLGGVTGGCYYFKLAAYEL